jgi:hypothetical protein
MSDRGLPCKKKSKKDKPKVKPIILSSDSESEPEVKKEKPHKVYDNYKEACNRNINNYVIS